MVFPQSKSTEILSFQYYFSLGTEEWNLFQLAGASYLEIHNAGGGIFYTVDKTVRCSSEELYQSLKDRLLKMLQAGKFQLKYNRHLDL